MNLPVRMTDDAVLCRSFGVERLWFCGFEPTSTGLAVAVVGARKASGAGVRLARELGAAVAKAGGTLLSGGAIGIDEAAHRGALDAGGATFAVLAGGLDHLYPERNRSLFEEMCERGGGLLSAFAPGTPYRRAHFPQRNELLARRARVIAVVEAGETSGALSTARAAAQFKKAIAAVPGTPGCDHLLGDGAEIVHSGDDLVGLLLGGKPKHHVSLPKPGSVEASILSELKLHSARAPETLANEAGMPIRRILSTLTSLELLGLARMDGERQYRQTELAHRLLGEQ